MKSIIPPEGDSLQLWTNIVNRKKLKTRVLLSGEKAFIEERYLFYKERFNRLDEVRPIDWSSKGTIKSELINCYGNNVCFNEAKTRLLSNIYRCPYCTINRPNTLDHYFDKGKYPEYAVFLPNLVPCCSECNSQKGSDLFTDDWQRQYIHFYFDFIPDYKFLFVNYDFSSQSTIPTISIKLNFQTNDEHIERMNRHYSKLKLLKKIKEAIVDRLPGVMKEMALLKRSYSNDIIKQLLFCQYLGIVSQKGLNYWEACMYKGIIDSADFLENVNAS